MAFGTPSLKGRALRYLAQREHSRAELARKLWRFTEAGEGIDAALDELTAHGLLSDERAAASVLLTQAPRSGQRRLKHVLQAKGLAPDLVAATLAHSSSSELERALALWQRRYGAAPQDAHERQRQTRFLQGRGFGFDVVNQVMRRAGAADASGIAPELNADEDSDGAF